MEVFFLEAVVLVPELSSAALSVTSSLGPVMGELGNTSQVLKWTVKSSVGIRGGLRVYSSYFMGVE